MGYFEYSKENLMAIANRSEFLEHAKNNPKAEVELDHALDVRDLTVELWQRKFETKTPLALEISGLFHDFDRFFPREMIDTTNITEEQYETAKLDHSKNSARIFRRESLELPSELKDDVSYMIERHEIGGDKIDGLYEEAADKFTKSYNLNVSSDQLEEADGLSFFRTILPSYRKWAPPEKVVKKIRFSFEKLPPEGKQIVRGMKYKNEEIRDVVLAAVGKA